MTTDAEKLVRHCAFIPRMVVWCIIYHLFYNLPTGGDVDICYLKDSLLWTYLKLTSLKLQLIKCILFTLNFI